jgi:hypothetical protein
VGHMARLAEIVDGLRLADVVVIGELGFLCEI